MRVQDFVANQIESAFDQLFRYAHAVPPEKVTWAPEGSRSTLEQVQECAQLPGFLIRILDGEPMPALDEAFMAKVMAERAQWETIGECERIGKFSTERLLARIRSLSDEELMEERNVPWGGSMPIHKLITFHSDNCTWHTGQIAFLQTMLGDMGRY